MISRPFILLLLLNGLRYERQHVPADFARRRAYIIQRLLCVEVSKEFKRQFIVVIQSLR
jgi:hypothetical protein